MSESQANPGEVDKLLAEVSRRRIEVDKLLSELKGVWNVNLALRRDIKAVQQGRDSAL